MNFTKVEILAASGGIFQILTLYVVHTKISLWASRMFLVFSSILQQKWKICVKEHWPKKLLFQKFWLNTMICYLRPKKRWNIFESLKLSQMTKSAKDQQSWIFCQFLVNISRAVNSPIWTFETDYTQKGNNVLLVSKVQQNSKQTNTLSFCPRSCSDNRKQQ